MALFGKREDPAQQSTLPVNRVHTMRQQGLSNNQIIETLQRDGYTSAQIFDAMNQLDIEPPETLDPNAHDATQPAQEGAAQHEDETPREQQVASPPSEQQVGRELSARAPHTDQDHSLAHEDGPAATEQPVHDPFEDGSSDALAPQHARAIHADAETEELIEAIIDEKWNELLDDVKRIVAWKSTLESVMRGLEQRLGTLHQNMEQLSTDIHAKLSEYDQAISNIGADVKALEKVYNKILPVFVEKVNQLNRSTQRSASSGKEA